MIIQFPQWQGAGDERLYYLSKAVLQKASLPSVSITLERHSMEVLKAISHYSAIHNHALRFRNLLSQHQPASLVTLGGDNSSSFIPISYLQQKHDHIKVMYLGKFSNENRVAKRSKVYFENVFLDFLKNPRDSALEKLMFDKLKDKSIVQVEKENKVEGILEQSKNKNFEKYYFHIDCNFFKHPSLIAQLLQKFVLKNSPIVGLTFAHIYALEASTFENLSATLNSTFSL